LQPQRKTALQEMDRFENENKAGDVQALAIPPRINDTVIPIADSIRS
jgi:hypothetical protein